MRQGTAVVERRNDSTRSENTKHNNGTSPIQVLVRLSSIRFGIFGLASLKDRLFVGPAVESFMHLASSDDDEPISAGSGMAAGSVGGSTVGGHASPSGGNGLSQESLDEEGLYQFRRSKATQYHKVSFWAGSFCGVAIQTRIYTVWLSTASLA